MQADGGNGGGLDASRTDAAPNPDAAVPDAAVTVPDAGEVQDAAMTEADAGSADSGVALPPQLASVAPEQGPPAGGTLVHLGGANLLPSPRVWFGEVEADFVHYIDQNALEVLLPPGPAGTVPVRVTNPDGQSATLVDAFTFTAARVVSVDVLQPDGIYGLGAELEVQLRWNQPVVVEGTPRLDLATGVIPAVAAYTAGSGSSTLRFRWVVRAGDNSTDLDLASAAALHTDGSRIQDLGGGAVVLDLPVGGGAGSLAGQRALVVDTLPPTWSGTVTLGSNTTADPSRTPDVTWTADAADENSGVATYQVAVGTGVAGPALRDVQDWLDVTSSPAQVSGLQLEASPAYTVSMRAVDRAGNASAAVVGPPFLYSAQLHLAVVTAGQEVEAGSCSGAVKVELQDATGTPVGSRGNTLLDLSAVVAPDGEGDAEAVQFFADPACRWWVSGTGMGPGESSAVFHVLALRHGQYTLRAAAGELAVSQGVAVLPHPSALDFPQAALSVTAGTCSPQSLALQVLDETGAPMPLPAAREATLQVTGMRPPTFYLDAACQTPVMVVPTAQGAPAVALYTLGHGAGDFTLSADGTGLRSAQASLHVGPGAPHQVLVTTAAQQVVAGTCSQRVDFLLADAEGNATMSSTQLTVTPASPDNGTLQAFSDATCQAAAATLPVPAGRSTGTLYFTATKAGLASLRLDVPALTAPPQVHTILADAPTQFRFEADSLVAAAGQCSPPVDLVLLDPWGNESAFTTAVSPNINMIGDYGNFGPVYANPGCTTQVNTLTLAPGQSRSTFFWTGQSMGTFTLLGRLGISFPQPPYYQNVVGSAQVQVRAGPPTQLVVSPASLQVPVDSCSPAVSVQFKDVYGNLASFPQATPVTLAVTGFTDVVFSAGAACGTAVTSVTVPADQTGTVFTLQGSVLGARPVHLAGAGMSADVAVSITATPAARLLVTQFPPTATAGTCAGPFRVQRQSSGGVPVLTGTDTVQASAWGYYGAPAEISTDGGCQNHTSTLVIPPGASTADFFMKFFHAGGASASFYVTNGGMSSTSVNVTVNAGPPAQLAFLTPSQQLTAGHCSTGPTRVELRDAWGNAATTATALPLVLSSDDLAGFTFYSDSTCTTAVTRVNVPPGAGSVDIYVKGRSAPSTRITVALESPAVSQTQVEYVNPDVPTVLAFTTGAQFLASGACSAITTVQSGDVWGNRSAVASDLLVSLGVNLARPTSGITVRFFQDQGCTTEIPSVVINGGVATASFYFRPTGPAGSAEVMATAAGFQAGTQVVTLP